MKVYVKRSDRPSAWIGYVVTLIFFAFDVAIFMRFIKSFNGVYTLDSLMTNLDSNWTPLIFGTIFAVFLVCFIFSLLKRPEQHRARLVKKTTELYKGQDIDYMSFDAWNKRYYSINCYTASPNELVVGLDYTVTIKGFSQKVIAVSELEDTDDVPDKEHRVSISHISPVFMAMGFFIIGQFVYPIIRLIYTAVSGERISINVGMHLAMMLLVAICFSSVFIAVRPKHRKQNKPETYGNETKREIIKEPWDTDITQPSGEDKAEREITKEPWDTKFPQPNSEDKADFVDVLQPVNTFRAAVLTHSPYSSRLATTAQAPRSSEIFVDGSDIDQLIKKFDLNISSEINLSAVKSFDIFRSTDDAEAYLVSDDDRNLLIQIKQNGLTGTTYTIRDQNGGALGELDRSFFSSTVEYLVKLTDLSPFYVRLRYENPVAYELSGSDYTVKGDDVGVESIIYGKDGNPASTVLLTGGDKKRTSKRCAEVTLSPNTENNTSLTLIALCLVMNSFDRYLN